MESFQTFSESTGVRIERIVSRGHSSSNDFCYDQDDDEWVILLQGEAVLEFAARGVIELKAGDHVLIPKHTRHRVDRTTADALWLAVHVKG